MRICQIDTTAGPSKISPEFWVKNTYYRKVNVRTVLEQGTAAIGKAVKREVRLVKEEIHWKAVSSTTSLGRYSK